MTLNPNAQLWVQALRSGEFPQASGVLFRGTPENKTGYCCLGVGCEVYERETGNTLEPKRLSEGAWGYVSKGMIPKEVQDWLGLKESAGWYENARSLYRDNDVLGMSFPEIADTISSEPEGLFAS